MAAQPSSTSTQESQPSTDTNSQTGNTIVPTSANSTFSESSTTSPPSTTLTSSPTSASAIVYTSPSSGVKPSSPASASSISTTTAPTPTHTKNVDVGDQSLSPGAIAGISIGTFFAGLILALLGVCIFTMLRKKKGRSYSSAREKQRYRDVDGSPEDGTSMKQMTSTVKSVGAGAALDIKLDKVLLEPVSSSDIKADMLTIGSQILQHVDNNYHLKPVDNLPTTFVEILTQDGYSASTGISVEQLGNLLRDAKTRRAAIRHLISYFIFSRVIFTSNIETSLLPTHIINFLSHIPPPEKSNGSREAFDLAFTKWRLLSAYLLQTVRSNRDPLLPHDTDIQPAITRNVTAIRQLLQPFVIAGAERRQAENLQGLMAEAARFALLLFQHPESWIVELKKTMPGGGGAEGRAKLSSAGALMVLFPGLLKTVDELGRRYPQPKVVVEAEVMQV